MMMMMMMMMMMIMYVKQRTSSDVAAMIRGATITFSPMIVEISRDLGAC